MRHDDPFHPNLARFGYQGKDFVPAEMPCCEDHIVLGNQFEALPGIRGDLGIVVEHGDRRACYTGGGDFALNLGPKRQLLTRAIQAAGSFVCRVYGRHPDDLVARPAGNFESNRVQAAYAVVERDRSVGHYARYSPAYDFCPFGGWDVVRLQDKPAQTTGEKIFG